MRKYSYESILRAVGRVLDLAEAERFTVRDTEDGLLIEAFDATSTPTVLDLDIPELAQLLEWAHRAQEERPRYERVGTSIVANEGTLHEVLQRTTRKRELVGAY